MVCVISSLKPDAAVPCFRSVSGCLAHVWKRKICLNIFANKDSRGLKDLTFMSTCYGIGHNAFLAFQ